MNNPLREIQKSFGLNGLEFSKISGISYSVLRLLLKGGVNSISEKNLRKLNKLSGRDATTIQQQYRKWRLEHIREAAIETDKE